MNPMRMTGLLLGLALLAPQAVAQDKTHGDVRKMVAARAEPGERLIEDIKTVEIQLYEYWEHVFTIDPAKRYRVYAGCDDNCGKIGIEAHDASDIVVAVGDGSEPMLMIGRSGSGNELHIAVSPGNCVTDICVVGFGVYEVADTAP